MSYVTTSGGGLGETGALLQKAGNFVPGWLYAGKKMSVAASSNQKMSKSDMVKTGLAVAAGVVAVLLLVLGLPIAIGIAEARAKPKSGMTTQWLGARHPNEVRLSDGILGNPSSGMKHDTFLGGNVGPEFVEQPNYVLGNENMMRTALAKYNRLKASGAQVSDWKTYWAAYSADNSDDLSDSLYDFGADGFNPKALRKAGVGTHQ